MLNQGIYSIFDSKAEAYSQPFFAPNDAVARRIFENSVNKDETVQLFHHPEDFTLFRIGDWDAVAGSISGFDAPRAVARGVDVKKESN